MAVTLLDYIKSRVAIAELAGTETVLLAGAESLGKSLLLDIVQAVKTMDGGPVSEIEPLQDIVDAAEDAATLNGGLVLTAAGRVVVEHMLGALATLLSESVVESTDEEGNPVTTVTPGYLRLTPDGALEMAQIDTTGIATQAWVNQQISNAIGSIALPEGLTREVAEEQFVQTVELGRLPAALPATNAPTGNTEMVMQLTSNTQLTIKVQGTDGTVRSVNLTLA